MLLILLSTHAMDFTVTNLLQTPIKSQRYGLRIGVDGLLLMEIQYLTDQWKTWLLLLHAFISEGERCKTITCTMVEPTSTTALVDHSLLQLMIMMLQSMSTALSDSQNGVT
uniref:Uncharacterized protein n=1 Tax=Opuntia streptacantha TaxID=393608 RepID=A0A7C8ZJM0_OPUST